MEYWKKWGRHYIPSVASAHKLQQCNNFKDPGVQCYGSKLFADIRDAADAAFDTLPAPNITPAMYRYLGGGKVIHNPTYRGASFSVQPQVSMSQYNDRYAGCIDGACSTTLASGERRRLADLAKGDVVMGAGPGGEPVEAEVVCMVRSRCQGGRAALVELPAKEGGREPLRLTPYHPVQDEEGEWRFPVDMGRIAADLECEAVYSFVLRGAPALLVAGLPCAAWAHGIGAGAAAHPYFASERVLQDLQLLPGYSSGLVDLLPEQVVRDPETGLVCGLAPPPAAAAARPAARP